MPTLTRPDGTQPQDLHLSRRAAVSMFAAGYALAGWSAEARPVTTPADGLTIEEVTIPNGARRTRCPPMSRGLRDGAATPR